MSQKKVVNSKKDVASIEAAVNLKASGWRLPKIAQTLNVSVATIKRWINEAKEKNIASKTPKQIDDIQIRNERLNKMSWKVLEDALLAEKPYGKNTKLFPDHPTRKGTATDVLHSQGELITKENKGINIVNVINIEKQRKEKLKTGLSRFGYEPQEVSNN